MAFGLKRALPFTADRDDIPFERLPSNSDQEDFLDEPEQPGTSGHQNYRLSLPGIPWSCHLIIFGLYTFTFLFLVIRNQSTGSAVPSPASTAIEYENVLFNASLKINSSFTGEPRPELDQAWSDLLQYSSIVVSGDDLRQLKKSSIAVPGTRDSYWVDLSVTHELHCIKRLYQYFHKDHYFPQLTPEKEELNYMHTDHCLEILRQASMCHGDISLIPMHWNPFSPIPEADFSVPHRCVNWKKLREWTRENSVDMMKPNFLQHPTLGPSFPDGSNPGIGVDHEHSHSPGHQT